MCNAARLKITRNINNIRTIYIKLRNGFPWNQGKILLKRSYDFFL